MNIMVAAIGSRVTQVGSTQPTEQFNPKQEMQIAQATISGKGDAIPILPQAAAETPPYTAGIKVFVGGRNYQSDNPLTIIKKVLKDNITLPSFSLPSFSLPKPAAPATQGSSAVADRIAQLERELAGKVESGASNNTPQAQKRIADIKKELAELRGTKVKVRAGNTRGMGKAASAAKNTASPMQMNSGKPAGDESDKTSSDLQNTKKNGGGGKKPDPKEKIKAAVRDVNEHNSRVRANLDTVENSVEKTFLEKLYKFMFRNYPTSKLPNSVKITELKTGQTIENVDENTLFRDPPTKEHPIQPLKLKSRDLTKQTTKEVNLSKFEESIAKKCPVVRV
jgi:hypothetical protein